MSNELSLPSADKGLDCSARTRLAIYNLLRTHPAKVTVEILGWAASAASIIAMAGDEIRMGLGSFMMIHNAWGLVIGNRHDMREAASLFDQFDGRRDG